MDSLGKHADAPLAAAVALGMAAAGERGRQPRPSGPVHPAGLTLRGG